MCTYAQCPEPNVIYDSWEEWTRHEQWTHQQRIWRCLEHPQHEYVELAAYEDHVRIYHAESVHQLLSTELLKSQESISQECDRPCPFCQCDFERPHDMQQHLAGHLEMIALLSLPNLDDIDTNSGAGKVESNEANRNYAESKADDFDSTEPLVFRDDDRADAPPATETDTEVFELGLKAESISFESRNEATIEAHEIYSKAIVEKWLSVHPYQEHGIAEYGRLAPVDNYESFNEFAEVEKPQALRGNSRTANHAPFLPPSPGQKESLLLRDESETSHGGHNSPNRQNIGGVQRLIPLAETAQDITAALEKFLVPVEDQAAEIAALMSICLSTSSALRGLDRIIGNFPYHPRYPDISNNLATVRKSLTFTFNDIQRLFGGLATVAVLPLEEYNHVWRDLYNYFRAENGTLYRRMEMYCFLLDGLSDTLIDG